MKLEGDHVMIDLETLGTGSNAVITSIGACAFTKAGRFASFYRPIDPQSCVNAGLKMTVSTVLWWMAQSEEARKELTKPGAVALEQALDDFYLWCPKSSYVWGNGAAFDNVILSNAYDAVNMKKPWPYWADSCYRTIKNMHPDINADPFEGVEHNAVDDARNQTEHLLKIYRSTA